MHPEDKVFASAGAGGKVVLREARIEGDEGFEEGDWGREVRTLKTGRDKYGMDLKFVSHLDTSTTGMSQSPLC